MNAGRPFRPLPGRACRPADVVAPLLAVLALLAVPGVPMAGAAAAAPLPADARLAIPDDAARLIIPGSTLVVAIGSLDEAEREWQDLAAAFGSRPTDKDYSLLSAFGDGLPGFADIVSRDRPLLVAVGVAGLMLGGGLDLTFVFPFSGDLSRLGYQGPGSPFVNLQQCGGYAALSSSLALRPLATPTAVSLPAGLLGATVDLGPALKLGLPLLESGMASLTKARPDSNGVMQPPLIAPEDLPAVNVALRAVARGVEKLELAIGRDGDRYHTMERLLLAPGSELAPGKQPSFKEAAKLTELLPAGADLLQVAAMDLTRPFAVFEPLYRADMRRTAAQLDPQDAALYAAWYDDYLGLVSLTAQPVAVGMQVTDAGAVVHAVMKARDGKGTFERLTTLLDRLAALPVPLRLEPMDDAGFPGADVRAYRVTLDPDGLLAPMPDGTVSSAQAAQLAQVANLLGRLIPEIRLARCGRYLLASADRDREVLGGMIAACRDEDRRGPVDPRPAQAAVHGDGHVQEVITGDLTAMWHWFTGMAGGVSGAPPLPPLSGLEALPCEMTMSAWEGGFSGTFSVQRADLLKLAAALAEPGRQP